MMVKWGQWSCSGYQHTAGTYHVHDFFPEGREDICFKNDSNRPQDYTATQPTTRSQST